MQIKNVKAAPLSRPPEKTFFDLLPYRKKAPSTSSLSRVISVDESSYDDDDKLMEKVTELQQHWEQKMLKLVNTSNQSVSRPLPVAVEQKVSQIYLHLLHSQNFLSRKRS